MRKQRKKASSNRLIIFGSLSVFAIVTFIATFISLTVQVRELNRRQVTIKNEIDESKKEEEYLKNEIVKLKDPDYLARYARENYMYSKDGEYIIKVTDEDKKDEIIITDKVDSRYLYISIVVGSFIIVIYVLKKIL